MVGTGNLHRQRVAAGSQVQRWYRRCVHGYRFAAIDRNVQMVEPVFRLAERGAVQGDLDRHRRADIRCGCWRLDLERNRPGAVRKIEELGNGGAAACHGDKQHAAGAPQRCLDATPGAVSSPVGTCHVFYLSRFVVRKNRPDCFRRVMLHRRWGGHLRSRSRIGNRDVGRLAAEPAIRCAWIVPAHFDPVFTLRIDLRHGWSGILQVRFAALEHTWRGLSAAHMTAVCYGPRAPARPC